MKVWIGLILSALSITAAPAWSVEPQPKVLMIADTGFSDSDPIIASHTVLQICIMDWYACPNGTNFQESGTAASLTSAQMSTSGFSHGSKMARGAIAANPAIKLILVRIIGQSSNGSRLSASESIVTKVLNWANKNASVYNIGAVAISQGSSKIGTNARKCLSSPATEKEVALLKAKGIYTFFPAGNEGRSDSINWPSCIADSIAVGALDKKGEIASYSNYAPGQVDLYEPGYSIDTTTLPQYGNENGTSYAVQYAAARWLLLVNELPQIRPTLIYWTLSFSGEPVSNAKGHFGWSTKLDGAREALGALKKGI
ncbi:T7SS_mycosin, type VII secretion-associated serine protease mycosin [Candidatus Nanopelagicaceae bacterium]